LRREEKLEDPEKTHGARTKTNKKLNPYMTPVLGIESGQHWWEASALTTVPFSVVRLVSLSGVQNMVPETLCNN